VMQAAPPEITLPGFWAVAIFAGWILLAAVATTRLAVGLWNLRKLRRNCIAIERSDLPTSLREAFDQIRATRPVAICQSSAVSVPTAIGFHKPLILVPEWVLDELSPEELSIVLLHEFAHLRRRDDWTNLAQKIVRAIFFFHPAVWWIERRLSLEREMACDDMVLAATKNSHAYAECLVSLAEKSFVRRGLAMAQSAINHVRETSLRLAQILDIRRPSSTRVFKPVLGVMAVFAALCLAVLPKAPTLIAFETAVPTSLRTSAGRVTSQLRRPEVVQTGMRIDNGASVGKALPVLAADRSADSPRMVAISQRRVYRHPGSLTPAVAKRPTPKQQLVVVIQTAQYEGPGSVMVTFRVWRVTFATADRATIHPELIARLM